jgi:type VI protein secretion system component VasK
MTLTQDVDRMIRNIYWAGALTCVAMLLIVHLGLQVQGFNASAFQMIAAALLALLLAFSLPPIWRRMRRQKWLSDTQSERAARSGRLVGVVLGLASGEWLKLVLQLG